MQEKIVEYIKEYKWQTGIVCLSVIIGICALILFSQPTKNEHAPLLTSPKRSTTTLSTSKEKLAEDKTEEIIVDVKGAVVKPGLYHLKTGARVNDAITAAGGFATDADQKSVNLAQKVTDESVIYVATSGENISVVGEAPTTDNHQSGTNNSKLVNLNTATVADLQTISGIGAKRAADIIAYREANGSFKSVDDLKQVSGIGDKTLENIRPYVTVD